MSGALHAFWTQFGPAGSTYRMRIGGLAVTTDRTDRCLRYQGSVNLSDTHAHAHTHTQAYLARNDLHDYFDWYCRPHQEGSPHQEDCPHQEDSELAQLS